MDPVNPVEDQDRPFEVSVLFESPDLLVRRVARGAGALCYVTFDSYTDLRTLDRSGFGEDFLRSRGIDAVHVLSRDNYWYQHPELPEALAAIAASTGRYEHVFAYGSSMGGFAALHYGSGCGARVGIAISPQYSVDPEVAPFEDRWLFDASRIAHRRDEMAPLPLQYIIYDPQDARDRAHFELFAARSPTIGLRVPYAGHPAGSYLHETQMFEPLFSGVHGRTLDAIPFERELRARRRMSGQYFFALSRRIPAYRRQQKVALARLAVEANPINAIYVSNLASFLDAAGEHEAAGRAHSEAMALLPDNLHVLHGIVLHREMTGDLDAARTLAEELVRKFPDVLLLRQTRRRLRRGTRQRSWYGKAMRRLHLDPPIDYLWEMATDGLLRPGPAFRTLLAVRSRRGVDAPPG